jgi:hypothetical protein
MRRNTRSWRNIAPDYARRIFVVKLLEVAIESWISGVYKYKEPSPDRYFEASEVSFAYFPRIGAEQLSATSTDEFLYFKPDNLKYIAL